MHEDTDQRPDPDVLLHEIRKETAPVGGRLFIFLGMCPGVGKTYAMLQAGRQRHAEGLDVLVGIVETHGRSETAALLEGLEVLPRKSIEYRGHLVDEFDLDGALRRRPTLVLVDELAHTNAPGSRHLKRYQDVLELLDAGIDVYSTLNVQHIDSQIDIVRQITGVSVQETVPDSLLDQAHEIQLIDLSVDKLLERLGEGKVYLGDRAKAAAREFFPGRQSHRPAGDVLALHGGTGGPRSGRHPAREACGQSVENEREADGGGRRESLFRESDPLDQAGGHKAGMPVACGLGGGIAFAGCGGTGKIGAGAFAGAQAWRGSNIRDGR